LAVLLTVIALATVLWGLYSLFSILLPMRPFKTRGAAAKSLGLSFLAFIALGVGIGTTVGDLGKSTKVNISESTSTPDVIAATQPSDPVLSVNLSSPDKIPEACGDGGLALNDVVAVTGEYTLREKPDKASAKIKNEKASEALGTTQYHQIDYSTTVRRMCVQENWTEVQIVTPDWLNFVKGWAPNSVLREIEATASGSRKYVEADFYWDDDTSRYKPEIIAVVNKIAAENRNCTTIDPSSVAKSSSRSKPGDPVFFVTCGSGADVFNVWFRPSDASGGQTFAAKEPLAKGAAVDACEAAARQAAIHPSTVSFSRVWDLAYMPHVSGRARVVSTFTAKNAFNLELQFRIDCLFDGPNMIETNISESQK
jgi:hypothetical protein